MSACTGTGNKVSELKCQNVQAGQVEQENAMEKRRRQTDHVKRTRALAEHLFIGIS